MTSPDPAISAALSCQKRAVWCADPQQDRGVPRKVKDVVAILPVSAHAAGYVAAKHFRIS